MSNVFNVQKSSKGDDASSASNSNAQLSAHHPSDLSCAGRSSASSSGSHALSSNDFTLDGDESAAWAREAISRMELEIERVNKEKEELRLKVTQLHAYFDELDKINTNLKLTIDERERQLAQLRDDSVGLSMELESMQAVIDQDGRANARIPMRFR